MPILGLIAAVSVVALVVWVVRPIPSDLREDDWIGENGIRRW